MSSLKIELSVNVSTLWHLAACGILKPILWLFSCLVFNRKLVRRRIVAGWTESDPKTTSHQRTPASGVNSKDLCEQKNAKSNLVWRRHLLGYYDTDRWLFISLRYFAARDKSKQQSRDLKSRLRQTADSCWEFLKIETQQIKQFKTILMDKNNEKLLRFCRRKELLKTSKGKNLVIHVCRLPYTWLKISLMFLKVTRSYGREFFLHFTEEKGIGCPWENWEFKLHVYGKRQTANARFNFSK